MTSLKNKVGAEANKVVGATKESVGKAVGNPNLQAQGKSQQVKGSAQAAVENVKDAVKSALK